MCSCTPKISCTTSTSGSFPPFSGIARYAGTGPVIVWTFTSSAVSPLVSVVIVVDAIGCTSFAKPCGSKAVTRSRRLVSDGGVPRRTDSVMAFSPGLESRRRCGGVERRLHLFASIGPAARDVAYCGLCGMASPCIRVHNPPTGANPLKDKNEDHCGQALHSTSRLAQEPDLRQGRDRRRHSRLG